ncbi:hypothetical protein METBIDRAFT_78192 [Metschnikowia bicuspidata var. bicuspidata NRRL YB-4993]|uniref:Uncharacterized protein n=1 Tax=Metschnikowia bicuspidata var. bicuspidata NRRL YB-4993 TaxID=869754 RepID=A0A1A0HAW3_9ASCO|nr:hypothetical protein METBIDRAFT_78192 [Metschnikowia bicuspidata var. bicuspidata NRRL YB-4993]OBA21135.1 hypothetical protein METBIDRAFT_78192 [Metschnikowia bicuspidata var. bicuspidata NRRL YB-4993]
MSLAARSALYFNYTICARLRLSPAPSCAKEVDFLLQNFRSIAPVDYFHVQQSSHSLSNPFRQIVTVVFNASEQPSQIDPFAPADDALDATPAQLEQRLNELLAYIRRICGIPRYSYIENDELYLEGRFMVPFQHKLLAEGQHLQGEYEISPSTSESPFFLLSGNHAAMDVLPHVRHNFQRLHKIEPLLVDSGRSALARLTGVAPDTQVQVNMNQVISTGALMDLDEELPWLAEKHNANGKFRGFW